MSSSSDLHTIPLWDSSQFVPSNNVADASYVKVQHSGVSKQAEDAAVETVHEQEENVVKNATSFQYPNTEPTLIKPHGVNDHEEKSGGGIKTAATSQHSNDSGMMGATIIATPDNSEISSLHENFCDCSKIPKRSFNTKVIITEDTHVVKRKVGVVHMGATNSDGKEISAGLIDDEMAAVLSALSLPPLKSSVGNEESVPTLPEPTKTLEPNYTQPQTFDTPRIVDVDAQQDVTVSTQDIDTETNSESASASIDICYVKVDIKTRGLWPLRYVGVTLMYEDAIIADVETGPVGSNNYLIQRMEQQLEDASKADKIDYKLTREDSLMLKKELVLHLDWGFSA